MINIFAKIQSSLSLVTTSTLLIFLACSCRLGPKYCPPEPAAPENWKNSTEAEEPSTCSPAPIALWWQVFEDPTLDYLEGQAITYNPQLYIAMDHVAQARAIVGIDSSLLYPQIVFNPGIDRDGIQVHAHANRNGKLAPLFPDKNFHVDFFAYNLPFNLSYELDLWGKIRGQRDAALYDMQAQEELLQEAWLVLTADVAAAYFQIRSLDAQIDIVHTNITTQQTMIELAQSRYEKGLSNYQDLLSAQAALSNFEAIYFNLIGQRTTQEDALATLTGVEASLFCINKYPLNSSPPHIPPGLPSEILLQRPDIAAAERALASNQAMIGVAYAGFFPSISLTGSLSYASIDLKKLVSLKSYLWSVGASGLQSIFDGGNNVSNLNLAIANFNEASHEYKQVVLTAFQEVEDSLALLEASDKIFNSYTQASKLTHKQSELAMSRYHHGMTNYIEVISYKQTELQAQLNQAVSLGQRYMATIQLIKALGGTWGSLQD